MSKKIYILHNHTLVYVHFFSLVKYISYHVSMLGVSETTLMNTMKRAYLIVMLMMVVILKHRLEGKHQRGWWRGALEKGCATEIAL